MSSGVWVTLGLLSIVMFVATLIVIPILLVRLPVDYFEDKPQPGWLEGRHPVLRIAAYALKNLIGAVFLVAGIAMLLLPGQGLLTMLIGVSLLDFPGKRNLQRRIVARPLVLRTINRIREKFDRAPLVVTGVEG